MGRVLDIVPNHMGIGDLEPATGSTCSRTGPARPRRVLRHRLEPVKDELTAASCCRSSKTSTARSSKGQLVLGRDGGRFSIRYHDIGCPSRPGRMPGCSIAASRSSGPFDADDEDVLTNTSASATPTRHLPRRYSDRARGRRARPPRERGDQAAARPPLRRAPTVREFLDEDVASFRRHARRPRQLRRAPRAARRPGLSPGLLARRGRGDQLPALLRYHRAGRHPRSRTRSLRPDPRLILRWVDEGGVTGLRIDHPDGLADPLGYFRRLQEPLFLHACRERLDAEGQGDDWERRGRRVRDGIRATVDGRPVVAAARGGSRSSPRRSSARARSCPPTGRSTARSAMNI